jgi:competence protein ComEC
MQLTKSKKFLLICLAFIIGISLSTILPVKIAALVAVMLVMGVSLGSNRIKFVATIGLIMLLGLVRATTYNHHNYLAIFYGQKQTITGRVVEEPDIRSDKVLLTISNLEIAGRQVPGKILLQTPKYPQYDYGTILTFTAKIEEPQDLPDFSYKSYLSHFGITAVAYFPKITESQASYGNIVKFYALQLKYKFNHDLSAMLPEPENGFLQGILTGQKSSIPKSVTDDFVLSGTSHIIAVSGYNITIIISWIGTLFSRFGRRASFVISLIIIILFVVITGAQPSVVRAAIMGGLSQIALNTGRIYYVTNALALTAVLMLMQNPLLLKFDIGFQLSFLSLIGLVYITPIFETKFPNAPKFFKRYLFPTISAQIASTPFILLTFERLSLVAPLSNLLVLPVIPLTMGLGFLAGCMSLLWKTLAQPIVWMTWLVLHLILLVIHVSANLPLASLTTSHIPAIIIVIFYCLLGIGLVLYYNPKIKHQILWK